MARRSTHARGKWANARSINSIITDYSRFKGVVEADCMRIMKTAADMTLEYIIPLVPEQTGALKASGRAQAIKTSKGVAAVVSFGGPDSPVKPTLNAPSGIVDYAAVVNYDLEKMHGNGEALFLEKGTAASKEDVDAYIMGELRKINP